jgi:hypothetical protein
MYARKKNMDGKRNAKDDTNTEKKHNRPTGKKYI